MKRIPEKVKMLLPEVIIWLTLIYEFQNKTDYSWEDQHTVKLCRLRYVIYVISNLLVIAY